MSWQRTSGQSPRTFQRRFTGNGWTIALPRLSSCSGFRRGPHDAGNNQRAAGSRGIAMRISDRKSSMRRAFHRQLGVHSRMDTRDISARPTKRPSRTPGVGLTKCYCARTSERN